MKQKEIKYRVWDKEESKMIYPNENGFIEVNGIEYCLTFDGRIYEEGGNEDATKRFIKLQYTGRKDKNKKKIYSGDIIEDKSEFWIGEVINLNKKDFLGYYVQQGVNPQVRIALIAMPLNNFEVIGDIYNNKDLLK